MNATTELTDLSDVAAAQSALTAAEQRVVDAASDIAAEAPKVAAAKRAYDEALDAGRDATKPHAAWAKALSTQHALEELHRDLAAVVERKRKDVTRAQKAVALTERQQIAVKVAGISDTLWITLNDVGGMFRELTGLDQASRACDWSIKYADEQSGEQTPLGASVVHTSRLGEKLWQLLRDLDEAVREQSRRRA